MTTSTSKGWQNTCSKTYSVGSTTNLGLKKTAAYGSDFDVLDGAIGSLRKAVGSIKNVYIDSIVFDNQNHSTNNTGVEGVLFDMRFTTSVSTFGVPEAALNANIDNTFAYAALGNDANGNHIERCYISHALVQSGTGFWCYRISGAGILGMIRVQRLLIW